MFKNMVINQSEKANNYRLTKLFMYIQKESEENNNTQTHQHTYYILVYCHYNISYQVLLLSLYSP